MSALFASEEIVKVNHGLYEKLKVRAEEEELKRFRFCMHSDHSSLVQEMIIAIKKGSYVQPHCHPNDRVESYSILSGKMDVIIFSENGELLEKITLCSQDNGEKIVRITKGNWHMPVPLSDWVIYHEVLQGPFDKKTTVEYADWAPVQGEEAQIKKYMEQLYGP